ncbi:MAG TPA: glycolate oxidase subunit GlcF [Vicinamibacterales bacterium]
MRALADDCVHCGFCLPACPTYLLWGREADSPRGRIYFMKAQLEGRPPDADIFRRHIDACLGCMACVTACPSGVQYGQLIEHTRSTVERQAPRPLADRLFRFAIFALFPHPARLNWIAGALRAAQRLGVQQAFRASGLASLLPARLAALERLAPPPARNLEPVPSFVRADGTARRRVGLLLGCVQRVFFPDVNHATARVLAAEGCEVVAPPDQQCCGALWLHAGHIEEARGAARRLIDAFDAGGKGTANALDHIVVNAAGCGSAMKEYGELLRDDPRYAERARAFARRCVDVSELLAGLEPRAARHPVRARVAYHDACHLNHAQRIRTPPRQLLRAIPGLELTEPAEPDVCCGSAGVYSLLEPDAGSALRDRKVAHVRATSCDVLVSSNPGCLLQIASGLNGRDTIRIMHLVEVLDASIRNDPTALAPVP